MIVEHLGVFHRPALLCRTVDPTQLGRYVQHLAEIETRLGALHLLSNQTKDK